MTALWSNSFSFFYLLGMRLSILTMVYLVELFDISIPRKSQLSNFSLYLLSGMLPQACQRSVLVLSMGMLMFAAKIYHITDLIDFLKSLIPRDVSNNVISQKISVSG